MNEWRQGGPAGPLMPQKETGRKSGPGQWSWDGAVKRHSEVGGGGAWSVNPTAPTTTQGPQLPLGEKQHPREERKTG